MNYDELLAPAAKAMRPSGIRKFFDLAADMPHCISLGVGEPDFKTPWSVRDAGIRSLVLRFPIAHHLTFFHLMSIQYKVNLNFTSTELILSM